MRSSDLEGWEWHLWPEPALSTAPAKLGVYVFRLTGGKCFARLKGESDIVYVGTNESGDRTIRDRLGDHFNSCADEGFWITRTESEVAKLDVAWKTFETHSEAEFTESELLRAYRIEHIELPPANRKEAMRAYNDLVYRVLQHPDWWPRLIAKLQDSLGRSQDFNLK